MSDVLLGEYAVHGGGSVDPSKYPDEVFELHSISAYDGRKPDILRGSEIGSSKKAVKPGDVLISRIVPHIRRAWVVGDSEGPRQIASSEWIIFRGEEIFPSYLRYLLLSDKFNHEFMRTVSGVGGSLMRARPAQVYKISVPIPKLGAQQRIAAILGKADAVRGKRQQAVDLGDELLRSVFQDMFGDPFLNQKKWDRKPLEKMCVVDSPLVNPADEEFQELPFIGPDRIAKDTGELLKHLSVRDEGVISKKFKFDSDHVLYTKIRPYLRKVAIPSFSGLCSADMYPVRAIDGEATKEFLWSLLISKAFVAYFNGLSDRANIPKMNRKELMRYEAICPPVELQHEYSRRVQLIMRLKAKQMDALTCSIGLFGSLTQGAFKGAL